jgi:hypothetical protein
VQVITNRPKEGIMNKTVKLGATGMGAAATLFAATFSLGGGAGAGNTRPADPLARSDVAACAHAADCELTSQRSTAGLLRLIDGGTSAAQLLGASGADAASGSTATNSQPNANDPSNPDGGRADGITVTIPRRVTVFLPHYEAGSPPGVTPPSYQPGTPPSVDQEGRRIVIDLGESGSMTPPSYQPGQPGTFTPPDVIVE